MCGDGDVLGGSGSVGLQRQCVGRNSVGLGLHARFGLGGWDVLWLGGWSWCGWLEGVIGGSLVSAPVGSRAALCVGHPQCGWRGCGVARRPAVGLGIGGEAWGFGCGHPCGVG